MQDNKITIWVDASFEQGKELFAWLKRYAKHDDGDFLYWDEFAFTVKEMPDCDGVLIFNNPSQKIETNCYPENVLAFMMEPGVYSENPWMFKGLQQFGTVYSPLQNSSNTTTSPGFLGWHVLQNWNELLLLPVPEKTSVISCIASQLKQFKGHHQRLGFIETLKKENLPIDFFGKGSNYIPDKADGLLSYRFSIAIENTSIDYYFTEKITDCFLTYTVPVYYGCKNIGKFFPEKSFVKIDITEPVRAIEKIRSLIEKNDWQERVPALQEARDLVLNKYQPLAGAALALRNIKPSVKRKIILRPVPDSLVRRARNVLHGLVIKK